MYKIFIFLLIFFGYDVKANISNTADEIIGLARDRDDGKSFVSSVDLTLYDKNGGSRSRNFLYIQKDFEVGDKFTIHFRSPNDVRNVAFHIENPHEVLSAEDRQWMYLPISRQTRRISTTDKRGSFMGSDYAYTDLDKIRVKDFSQKLLGEETINDRQAYKISRTPISQAIINKTGYHKVVVWIDKENYLVLRQDFYDIKGILFKKMLTHEVERVDGIDSIILSSVNHLINGTRTEMRFKDLRYNVPLKDKLFTKQIIRRGIKSSDIPK